MLSEARQAVMRQLVRTAFSGPVTALEIGVWFGTGSTQIWMKHLPKGSELILLDGWRPYASADDQAHEDFPTDWDYRKNDDDVSQGFSSTYEIVTAYEARGGESDISIVRAASGRFLRHLKNECCDFVFIDGDHKYDAVKQDIVQAKRLINRSYGVICGDDLEHLPNEELIALCKRYKQRDYLGGDAKLHPGVCLAVSEEFGTVNMKDGVWWTVCQDDQFRTDVLTEDMLGPSK